MKNLSMHGYAIYSIHALFCLLLVFNFACEDDNHDHDDEHTDADGFVFENESGTAVYTELEGEVTGSITISVGDTLELSVHFLDHEGDEIEHEENEDEDHEDELSISGNDSNIAIVEAEDHEEEGDDHNHDEEEHGMTIHVIGVSAGSTSFQLQLMHEGHSDYTSTNNVPVVVN